MSSDQDRQHAREQLRRMLGDQFPRSTAADVEFGTNTVIALVETVIRAAGGEVRTETGSEYLTGVPGCLPNETYERTVYAMPWRKVKS